MGGGPSPPGVPQSPSPKFNPVLRDSGGVRCPNVRGGEGESCSSISRTGELVKNECESLDRGCSGVLGLLFLEDVVPDGELSWGIGDV